MAFFVVLGSAISCADVLLEDLSEFRREIDRREVKLFSDKLGSYREWNLRRALLEQHLGSNALQQIARWTRLVGEIGQR
ncbi:MAG: hypothetical protein BZY88_12635 [SAR202 cluster bacterium Io17-Chloro-G9]|nr:MAG: hypothetical protein BZY88_12635 [SAR202 cluster bacterium Io17-Chloro-G9]